MAKGVIVVDMPEYCDYCPVGRIFGFESGVECLIATNGRSCVSGYGIKVKKPEWCPIKPMPDRWEVCGKYPQPGKPVPSYRIGWNACLDKIEGK